MSTKSSFTSSKWFRLSASLSLAFVLALTFLLLPIVAGSVIQVPVAPQLDSGSQAVALPNWSKVDVPVPFGADDAFATTVTDTVSGATITVTKRVYTNPFKAEYASELMYVYQSNPKNDPADALADRKDEVALFLIEVESNMNVQGPLTLTDVLDPNAACATTNNGPDDTKVAASWGHNTTECKDDGQAEFKFLTGGTAITAGQSMVFGVGIRPKTKNVSLDSRIDNHTVSLQGPQLNGGIKVDFNGLGVKLTIKAPNWAITKTAEVTAPGAGLSDGAVVTYSLNPWNAGDYGLFFDDTNPFTVQDVLIKDYVILETLSYTNLKGAAGHYGYFVEPIVSDTNYITLTWVITADAGSTNVSPNSTQITGTETFSQQFGSPITYSYRLAENHGLRSGDVIRNQAKVWGGENALNIGETFTDVYYYEKDTVLTVTKLAWDEVYAEEDFAFTVTLEASGTKNGIANIYIEDDISELTYTTFVDVQKVGGPAGFDLKGTLFADTLLLTSTGVLTNHEVATFTLNFKVDEYAPPAYEITNTFSTIGQVASDVVRAGDYGVKGGRNPYSYSNTTPLTAVTWISATNDIHITKTVEPAVVQPGGLVTYTIHVVNEGNGLATVAISDSFGAEYENGTGITFTSVETGFTFSPVAFSGQEEWNTTVELTKGTGVPGATSAGYWWQIQARAATTTNIDNSYTNYVTATYFMSNTKGADNVQTSTVDVDIANSSISMTKVATYAADLSAVSSRNADLREQIVYGYRISNTGSVTLENLELFDDIMGVITSVDTLTTTTSLTPDQAITVIYTYTLDGADITDGTFITNTAWVTGDILEDYWASSAITTTSFMTTAFITVSASPVVSVMKEVSAWESEVYGVSKVFTQGGPFPSVGDIISYTYWITNNNSVGVLLENITDDRLTGSSALDVDGKDDFGLGPNTIMASSGYLTPLTVVTYTRRVTLTSADVDFAVGKIITTTSPGLIFKLAAVDSTPSRTLTSTVGVLTNVFQIKTLMWEDKTTLNAISATAHVPLTYTAGFSIEKRVYLLDANGARVKTGTGKVTDGTVSWMRTITSFTPTAGARLQYEVVITNFGGITLTGEVTDTFYNVPTTEGIFTTNIKIPPRTTEIYTDQLKSVSGDNLGDLTLRPQWVITNQWITHEYPALVNGALITVPGSLTNTLTFKLLATDTVVANSYPSLYKSLDDNGFANTVGVDKTWLVTPTVDFTVTNVISLPITYTAGITIHKAAYYDAAATQIITQGAPAPGVFFDDTYYYSYTVENIGTVPISITAIDYFSNSQKTVLTRSIFPPSYTLGIDKILKEDHKLNVISPTLVDADLWGLAGTHPISADVPTGAFKALTNTIKVTSWVEHPAAHLVNAFTSTTVTNRSSAGLNYITVTLQMSGGLLTIEKTPYLSRADGSGWVKVVNGLPEDGGVAATIGDVITYEITLVNDATDPVVTATLVDMHAGNLPSDGPAYLDILSVDLPCVGARDSFTITAKSIGSTEGITCTFTTKPVTVTNMILLRAAIGYAGLGRVLGEAAPTEMITHLNFVTVSGWLSPSAVGIERQAITAKSGTNDKGFTASLRLSFTNDISISKHAATAKNNIDDASGLLAVSVNEPITYTYYITNVGNVDQNYRSLLDTIDGLGREVHNTSTSPQAFNLSVLRAGQSVSYTEVYTPKAGDVAYAKGFSNYRLTNTVKAIYTPTIHVALVASHKSTTGIIAPVEATAQAAVVLTSPASIDVKKTVVWGNPATTTITSPARIGDVVTYTYVITNDGSVNFSSLARLEGGWPLEIEDDQLSSTELELEINDFFDDNDNGNGFQFPPTPHAKGVIKKEVVHTLDMDDFIAANLDGDNAFLTNKVTVTGYVEPALATQLGGTAESVPVTATVPLTYDMGIRVGKVVFAATDPVTVGNNVIYTYTIYNDGDFEASVMLSDTFGSGHQELYGPYTVSAGINRNVTITVQLLPKHFPDKSNTSSAQTISNTVLAIATVPSISIITGTYEATDTAEFQGILNFSLDISKTFSLVKASGNTVADVAEVGDQLTYVFNMENTGTSSITFDLDDQFFMDKFEKGRGTESVATSIHLDAGVSTSRTQVITVADNDIPYDTIALELRNQAHAKVKAIGGADTPVITKSSNIVSVPLTYTLEPQIVKGVEGLDSNGRAQVGVPITYTYRVLNLGKVTFDAIVTDDPLGLINSIEFRIEPGSSDNQQAIARRIYTPTMFDLLLPNQTLYNTGTVVVTRATVSAEADSNVVDVIIAIDSALAITKTANVTTAAPGDSVTYNIEVENAGTLPLVSVTVQDPMLGTDETIASLTPGQSQSFEVVDYVIPADTAAGSYINTATATGYVEINGQQLPLPAIATDSWTIDVVDTGVVTLTVNKTASPSSGTPVISGTPIVYTIMVTNIGTADATGVQVVDTLPDGLTLNASDSLTIGNLAKGANQSVVITAMVTTDVSGTLLINSATANDDGSATGTSNTVTHTVVTVLPIAANIVVVKSVDRAGTHTPLEVGDTLTFTIIATNTGNGVANNVVITDALSADLGVVSVTPDTATTTDNTVVLNAGSMEPDVTKPVEVTIVATVTANAVGKTSIANTANLSFVDPTTGGKMSTNGQVTVPADPDDLTVTVPPIKESLYLPIILRQPASTTPTDTPTPKPTATSAPGQPDLESSMTIENGKVQVQITNVGGADVTNETGFWVEAYIFETEPADGVKMAIGQAGPSGGGRWETQVKNGVKYGIAWQITPEILTALTGKRSIAPNQIITLVMDADGTNVVYDKAVSSDDLPATLSSGMFVISYVDSYTKVPQDGWAILEADETDNANEITVP
ncbi:hypothetical protein QUF63_13565 [Anaerolineales bacterium HSG25]|nr:hypothetical protein [Anaerolineales bacterium HSG25]